MHDNDLRARVPAQGVVAPRSEPFVAEGRASGLIVVSVALAIAGAVTATASSPDQLASMVFGVGLFVTGPAIAVASAASLPRTVTADIYGSLTAMQLGPDPEQVIGRQTGARTYLES
jgi:hypothetical protein